MDIAYPLSAEVLPPQYSDKTTICIRDAHGQAIAKFHVDVSGDDKGEWPPEVIMRSLVILLNQERLPTLSARNYQEYFEAISRQVAKNLDEVPALEDVQLSDDGDDEEGEEWKRRH